MIKNQVDIITMGCSKNLVDSEILMKLFEENGYRCVHDSKNPQGEIAVVNTCGFIGDAKEESINTILEFIERKKEGKLKKLFVMGCLSQRYPKELEDELPEVDLLHLFTTAMEGRGQRPYGELMGVALKKCGVVDAKAYYAYFGMAEERGIVHKEAHPETGVTWVELLDNTLPF